MTKAPVDFDYHNLGMFVLLLPNTPRAIEAWEGEIACETEGTGKFLAPHWPSVRRQLRAAGFTVQKGRVESKQSRDQALNELDQILSELNKQD